MNIRRLIQLENQVAENTKVLTEIKRQLAKKKKTSKPKTKK